MPLLVLTATLVTAGCASLVGARTDQLPHAGVGTTFHAMRWQGRTRTFLLHLPPAVRRGGRVPVVILLHGSGASANLIMDETHMNERADSAGFAVAYPNGTGRFRYFFLTWNSGGCCGDAHAFHADDVGFLRALIHRLVAEVPIDSTRVYVAGFSDGGRLAYLLGCYASEVIAGIGSVAGGMPDTLCPPALPVAVDIVHGMADRVIPYGGPDSALVPRPSTVQETFAWWARRDSCERPPAVVRTDSVVTADYAHCSSGTEVELHSIIGGPHGWPGGTRGFFTEPKPSQALDAGAELLRFFARHQRAR